MSGNLVTTNSIIPISQVRILTFSRSSCSWQWNREHTQQVCTLNQYNTLSHYIMLFFTMLGPLSLWLSSETNMGWLYQTLGAFRSINQFSLIKKNIFLKWSLSVFFWYSLHSNGRHNLCRAEQWVCSWQQVVPVTICAGRLSSLC